MHKSQSFFLVLILLLLTGFHTHQEDVIRVACVGDSITYGSGIENREVNSYPAQLQKMLGPGWEVQNFGISGATMLKKGDKPYWELDAFQQAQDFNPDVVVIKLGTNDTKPQNWKYGDQYEADYRAMVKYFQRLDSQPEIWICLPAPVFEDRFGITASVVDEEVLPAIRQVKKKEKVKLINLYRALQKKPELFPDGVHPDAEGAKIIARTVAKKIQKAAG